MTEFHKLVRDDIPEIIKADGKTPEYRVLEGDEEYLQALLDKDVEEGLELAENPSLEELADKMEVIYAIAKALGYSLEQLEEMRLKKRQARGGFDKRIFLERTD